MWVPVSNLTSRITCYNIPVSYSPSTQHHPVSISILPSTLSFIFLPSNTHTFSHFIPPSVLSTPPSSSHSTHPLIYLWLLISLLSIIPPSSHPIHRLRRPACAWSSWSVSLRRPRRSLSAWQRAAGSYSRSWTRRLRPMTHSVARSHPSGAKWGSSSHKYSGLCTN